MVVRNLRLFRKLKERLFPLQITKRVYFSVIILILIPVVSLVLLLPFEYINARMDYRSKDLYHVASLLESRFPRSLNEILAKNQALGAPPDAQALILNKTLQPIINDLSRYYPGMGLGYYSIQLDRVLAVGPKFSPADLKPVPHSTSCFKVYTTGRPELSQSDTSMFWDDQPILNLAYPIYRNGRIIGHAWADVKTEDIYRDVREATAKIVLLGLGTLAVSILLAWRLFNRLSLGLQGFARALVLNTYEPEQKFLPELTPVWEIVKGHTEQVFLAYAQLQEEVAIRQETEDELRRSHDQISNILASITDAYIAVDPEWCLTDLNQAAEVLLGQSLAKLKGLDMLQDFPLGSKFKEHYQRAMVEQETQQFEEFSELTGKWLEVHAYPSRYGLFAYFHDITDRKEAEKALRQSEERFFKAFNASPSMMNIVRIRDWQIIDANESFFAVSGWSREEAIGRTAEELNIWSNQEDIARMRQEIINKGMFHNLETTFQLKDKRSLTTLVSAEKIELGLEPCILVAITDITERKQMEKEMLRLDRLNLLGEMAAGISHEVRNPLTTIRGFLQILKGKPDCQRYAEYYTLMIAELDRANAIITEFLSIGRNKGVERLVQSLNSIIEALAPLIQADAVGNDKSVVLDLGNIPALLLNEKEIRQVVLNLARNGLEAMKPGGTLTIRTYADEENVFLAVADQGSGISPEHLDKLGTPFFTTKEQGTGLGLAVCYGIAARHQARIRVDTGPTGTVFRVCFGIDGEFLPCMGED